MDRCKTETRRVLQRILSGWFELGSMLSSLEEHLAENTGYIVEVRPSNLALSATRIAKYLAEDHPQPAAAIAHLHDWLAAVMGSQQRADWVGFLARVQGARGLTTEQRADFVVIAETLCFPSQPPEHATSGQLAALAEQALAGGTPAVLLVEIDRVEAPLGREVREAVERSRARLPFVQRRLRIRPLVAVAVALLATAGVVTAVLLAQGPPPLPGQEVKWNPEQVEPNNASSAQVTVPEGARRLVVHVQLTDPHPDKGSCRDIQVALATDPGQSTGWHDWQAPDVRLSVDLPAGHSTLTVRLQLGASPECGQHIDTQRVEFER